MVKGRAIKKTGERGEGGVSVVMYRTVEESEKGHTAADITLKAHNN